MADGHSSLYTSALLAFLLQFILLMDIVNLFLSFQIEDIETSITHFFLFPPKVEKLNISAIYEAIIVIFSVNLPMVFICKFL